MPPVKVPSVILSNMKEMLMVGFGTAGVGRKRMKEVLENAMDVGYRQFDTAWYYNNQLAMGSAFKGMIDRGVVKREDLQIGTKVWVSYCKAEDVLKSCKSSLNDLQIKHLDCYIIHLPWSVKSEYESLRWYDLKPHTWAEVDYLETWKGMEECYKQGLVSAIGVSNFSMHQINRLMNNCSIKPHVNQYETHPYCTEDEMTTYCKQNNIAIQAYGSLGAPYTRIGIPCEKNRHNVPLIENPVIQKIAKIHNKTSAQVCLKWAIQRHIVVLPKTMTRSRMEENLDLFSWKLSDKEMTDITALNCNWKAYPFYEFKDHPNNNL